MSCSICLNEITENNYTTLCGHSFHKNCLSRWFNSHITDTATCPMCRGNIIYDRGMVEYWNVDNMLIKKIIDVKGETMFYQNGNLKHVISIDRITNQIRGGIIYNESNTYKYELTNNDITYNTNQLNRQLQEDDYSIV